MRRYFLKRFVLTLKTFFINRLFFTFIASILLVVLVIFAVENLSIDVAKEQEVLIKNAVTRSAVQCYALEGAYPSDLQYLIDNYGFYYDQDNYIVHFESLGGNLFPDIQVFYIEGF